MLSVACHGSSVSVPSTFIMRTGTATPLLALVLAWLVAACYDGEHLGFVPCEVSEECDAPPRDHSRRACLHVAGDEALPGYCALVCRSDATCAGEAPGSAGQEAVCSGSTDMPGGGLCVLLCGATLPCPSQMVCLDVKGIECSDSDVCACYPAFSGAGE